MNRLSGLLASRTSRDSAWVLLGEGGKAVLMIAVTFVLTQVLTRDELGVYSAAMAVGTTATFVAFFGAPWVVMKRVSRGQGFVDPWARMLGTMLLGSSAAIVVLVWLVRPLFLGDISRDIFILFVVSRVLWMGFGEACVTVATAQRSIAFSSLLRVGTVIGRLLAALIMAAGVADGLRAYAWLFFWSSAATAILMVVVTAQRLGGALRPQRPSRGELGEGWPLALKFSTASILDSVDRPMLVSAGLASEAGVYSVGYSVAGLGQMPVMAVVRATTPEFFARGDSGVASTIAYARRLVGPALAIGLVSAAVTFAVADVVVSVLGPDYGEAASVIRWLAIVPALKALQHFPANALTGADRPLLQVGILGFATGVNVVLNLILLQRWGLEGAVAATLAAEAVYAALLWAAAAWIGRREG